MVKSINTLNMNSSKKIELLSVFGDDNMVIGAARVSFQKQAKDYDPVQNAKLINYLAKHNHTAPFYHPKLQFRITCPIYVERQIFKTTVGVDVNSISGRYVDFSDSYTRITEWRKQSTSSKQGSDGPIENQSTASQIEDYAIQFAKAAYDQLLELGVSKEQARTILPLNLNTTFIWTGSLYALIRLCQLRLKPDAQAETRELVQEMLKAVQDCGKFPETLKAFGYADY